MTQEINETMDDALLQFDHNIIEHLGIRLYQNKVINVLSELIANSWDADAEEVSLTTSEESHNVPTFLAVSDNGSGMDYQALKNRYLVIGKPKRQSQTDRSPKKQRLPMGRKGIGKLAPFGIATQVDVATVSSGIVNWLTLDLSDILQLGSGNQTYAPVFHLKNTSIATLPQITEDNDPTKAIREFFSKIDGQQRPEKSGTLILMSKLTTNSLPSAVELQEGIAARFTVVLLRSDFELIIRGHKIDAGIALPKFELRIPDVSQPYQVELIDGKEVRWWVGFVEKADWSSDQAGVGVFVHGKIGQDRPFFFGAKGKEIYQRYLYAVVEADWIDGLDHDLVSTDRTSIDWQDPAAIALYEWGKRKVSSWLDNFVSFRNEKHDSNIRDAARRKREAKEIPVFSGPENAAIDELVVKATRELGKGSGADKARDELLSAVSAAWTNLPSRRLVQEIWSSLGETGAGEQFTRVVEKLHEHSVPEAMGLAVTFAQRAYALSLLNELIHRRSETKLQLLVEEFPWILEPRGEVLTADKQLKTTIEAAADSDDKPVRGGKIIRGMSAEERADFVFLIDSAKKIIQIVEIKGPTHVLENENRRQLADYLDYVEAFHGSATISGLLVGNPGNPRFDAKDTRITVKGWDEILLECRASYIDLLAAMLSQADPAADDSRIGLVHEFGGEAIWELLNRLAEKDENLEGLMKRVNDAVKKTRATPESGATC
jgi:hypothetical protein